MKCKIDSTGAAWPAACLIYQALPPVSSIGHELGTRDKYSGPGTVGRRALPTVAIRTVMNKDQTAAFRRRNPPRMASNGE